MTAPREAIQVIGDVISNQLNLINTGKRSQIMMTYERFDIPVVQEQNDLYIALNYIDGKAIGNDNYVDGNTLVETQSVVMFYHIQIDIMSFGPQARQRKEEVYQALKSLYAQQQMEINNMQIARMPSAFANASSLEETKFLNRFTMTIGVTALLTKTQPITQTYDSFPFQFDDNGMKSPVLTPEDPF